MRIDMNLVGQGLGSTLRTWDEDDAILYALGVGAGAVPGAVSVANELAYTTENSRGVAQQVLPSYAAVLAFPPLGSTGDGDHGGPSIFGNFPPSAVLHANQALSLHGALPVEGAARVTAVVSDVQDTGKDALVTISTELVQAGRGRVLAESRSTFLIRGAGGFGGRSKPEPDPWQLPERAPDHVVQYATTPAQGLLYRLSGDRNRLHSDPSSAREAGFDGPILHGLCTFGFAGRAILHEVSAGSPEHFGSMQAGFTSPVYPGDALTVRLWENGEAAIFQDAEFQTVQFQVLVGDRVVMDRGLFTPSTLNRRGDGND